MNYNQKFIKEMGAIFSLFDSAMRTPDQIIRIFYKLYNQESVRQKLWESFRGFAVNDEKGPLGLLIEEKEVALLFDQLIDLVGAVQVLQNTQTEQCFFCGSVNPASPEQSNEANVIDILNGKHSSD